MRKLEECRAEIFRRSEERIRERKRKQKQLAAIGVSLCVCVCLGTKLLLPGMGSANEMFPEGENQPMEDIGNPVLPNDEGQNIFSTYVEAEILVKDDEGETVYKVTTKADVDRMYGAILSIVHSSDEENFVEDKDDLSNLPSVDEVPEDASDQQSSNKEEPDTETENESDREDGSEECKEMTESFKFIIVFKGEDGGQIVYTLEGNCLTDRDTGKRFILKKSQLRELKTILGL